MDSLMEKLRVTRTDSPWELSMEIRTATRLVRPMDKPSDLSKDSPRDYTRVYRREQTWATGSACKWSASHWD